MKLKLSVILACFLFPLVSPNDYYIHVACMIGIWIILTTGLNLIFGFTGQISLGHGAFYGIGAYGVSYFQIEFGIPFIFSVPMALSISGLFAYILGIPTLRLKHHYLALATLGFGIVMEIVMIQWQSVTGGAAGLYGIPDLIFWGNIIEGKSYYYVVLCANLLIYYVNAQLLRSTFGRAFVAIRESEIAGSTLGINTARYKNLAFTISAMMAALAGCLYAHLNQYLSPELFGPYTSIYVLAAVIVGGKGKTAGAIVGAFFMILLPEFLYFAAEYSMLVNASIFLLVLVLIPDGIVGFISRRIPKLDA